MVGAANVMRDKAVPPSHGSLCYSDGKDRAFDSPCTRQFTRPFQLIKRDTLYVSR